MNHLLDRKPPTQPRQPYNTYRQALAWIGFAVLYLLMPAIVIWALYNLLVGTSTYERDVNRDANSEAHTGALDAPLSAEA